VFVTASVLEVKPSIQYVIKITTTVGIYLPAWERGDDLQFHIQTLVFEDQELQTLT